MALFGLVKNFIQKIDEHISELVNISEFRGKKEEEVIKEVEKSLQAFNDEVSKGTITISANVSINEAKESEFSAELFGFGNIPDISFTKSDGKKYAIEFKRAKNSSDIKSVIGQAIVYSTGFDEVLVYVIDESKDSKISNKASGNKELSAIKTLWDRYRVKMVIV